MGLQLSMELNCRLSKGKKLGASVGFVVGSRDGERLWGYLKLLSL